MRSGAIALWLFSLSMGMKYFVGLYNNVPILWLILFHLCVALVEFLILSRQFVCVDEDGITIRYGLWPRRVNWRDVNVMVADWSKLFERLPDPHPGHSWTGALIFKGKNSRTLLKVKIDLGPIQTRRQVKEFIERKLNGRIAKA
ncbi:MAG TPA: hypothetical protein VF600_07670 [Abditibacteriaceae bacterium]